MPFLPKSKKARRRLLVLAVAAPILALAVGLTLLAMRNAVNLYYGPSDAQAAHVPAGKVVRIGGLVQPGSVVKELDGEVRFSITDNVKSVQTRYKGEVPDLFREGQGVVAQGEFDGGGVFQADEILAKHDEKYMPKEVVASLKKAGKWREPPASGRSPS